LRHVGGSDARHLQHRRRVFADLRCPRRWSELIFDISGSRHSPI